MNDVNNRIFREFTEFFDNVEKSASEISVTYASLCDRAGVNKDILKRAVGHTPKSKTLDEVYLHPKAHQMIEVFDKANQLVNNEVLTTTKV